MLEQQLKELIKALNDNTQAILSTKEVKEKVKEKVKDFPIIPNLSYCPNYVEVKEVKEIITLEEVKKIAKDKIANGAPRQDIKNMIIELGGESLVDLDVKQLTKLKKQIEKL